MRTLILGVLAITTAIALPFWAQTSGPNTPPRAPLTAVPIIRDCLSISAGDRNLAPLVAVCESVKAMHRTLPNFVCEQTTQRYTPIFRHSEERRAGDAVADTIRATVTYEGGMSRYTDIKVGDKPLQGEMFDVPGTMSIGEFGSELVSIFSRDNAAVFDFRGTTKNLVGDDYHVFGFRISAANNHSWMLREGNLTTHPGLEGELWVSKDTSKVLRLNILAERIDRVFAADHVRVSTLFADVQFGDAGEFLLPRQSETKVCTRDAICMHNVTEWANCKRFAGKARMIFRID